MGPDNSRFPFPRDMFLKFVHENEGDTSHRLYAHAQSIVHILRNTECLFVQPAGYFPVKLECLQEGTCIHPHVPVYQVQLHPG